MTRIKMHISKVKLPFYHPCEVKYRLQNRVSTGGKSVKVFSDSRLVVNQVREEFKAKDERMQGYLSQVKYL